MRLEIIKIASVCILGISLLLINVDEIRASSVKGADPAAGAAVVLEQYYSNVKSIATKELSENGITTKSKGTISVVDGYSRLGVANVDTFLNIRETPESGKIIGKLPNNAGCEILEELNGWYLIESGEVKGYVSSEYIITGDAANVKALEQIKNVATVTADALFLREEANTDSSILEILGNSEKLEVIEVLDEWAKIVIDSTEGYVSTEYIAIAKELPTAMTLSQIQYGMDISTMRIDMVTFAQEFVGNPYVYGGNSLTKGTDCSGFTKLIYQKYGYNIPRTATTQYNYGTKINVSNLKPGDLVIYGERKIEHVGMYIGNNRVVHASSARTGIKYSNLNYRNIIAAVSIIND
ncbi:MAG: C40 family peptidase [Clostridiales bacterium]|nr:C40 family peptidase [Clostridiales bacterium]